MKHIAEKTLTSILLLVLFLATSLQGQHLTTLGEIHDGTAYDIAAGHGVLYLAQGRHLALLDPATGLRLQNYTPEPYPAQLVAVEFDKDADLLVVATLRDIHIYDQRNHIEKVWHNPFAGGIQDFKCIAADKKIVAVLSSGVVIIDYSTAVPAVVSLFSAPEGISFFSRVHVAETRKGQMAYLSGFITGQQIRGINGLVIANLDSANQYAAPYCYPSFWNPVAHYGSPAASVMNVQVAEDLHSRHTYAFVACGTLGQLTVLDVTDPAAVSFMRKKDLFPGFPAFNLLLDEDNARLFVATANILHVVHTGDMSISGSVNAGFYNAGNRDMALFVDGPKKQVWTATNWSVDYVINAVDVTTDKPVHAVAQWWISSSDGAVAVPEWNSVYLPTFGGVVRYDVSDLSHPVAVYESYQPTGGFAIEHIDIVFPDPDDPDHALLLTAPGNGGIQYWPVSKVDPNPGPPAWVCRRPEHWGADPVYQNDVGHFRKDGVNYFLADLANRSTNEVALQIYNTSTGEWINVFEQSDQLKANAHSILVHDEHAFVTCNGGFFVVDLSQLPYAARITDVVVNDWNDDGRPNQTNGIMISPRGEYLFVAHDPGVVQSFAFDATTGTVSGPLDKLYGEGITGCTNRGRYFCQLDRLYVAARGGNILEIDAGDPYNLELLSVWNNGAYRGEMQDCRIYDFGEGPSILAVKNNEGFAILKINETDPVDTNWGLVAHWSFDNDIDEIVIDESPNQFHGRAQNVQYEVGPISKAAVFNGYDSRIDIPAMNSSPPAEIGNLETGSISLWFKFQSQGGDILPLLYFGESNSGLPHNSLILEIGHNQDSGDRRLYFTIVVAPFDVTRFCFDSGFNLDEETWCHFVAVVNRNGNTGYLNGEELVKRRYNLNSDASFTDFFVDVTAKKQLTLGYGRYARNPSFFHFKGSIDDVRLYDRPLSWYEVKRLYDGGSQ